MTSPRARPRRALLVASLVAAAVVPAGCGGDDEPQPTAPRTTPMTLPSTITTSTSTTATTATTATTGTTATIAPAAGPRPGLVVGIGEQQAAMFRAPRFRALGLDHVRLVVAYDTVRVRFEREIVDNWLAEARRAGAKPFITFQHSRVHPRRLPSVAEFRADFRAFRKRYPQVRIYAPWNEVNHATQPTANAPARAAAYYDVVQADCAGCTVLAGDVLDQPGMTRYVAEYRRHLTRTPRIWGLHNYADANRFRTSGLRSMLKAVAGEIWLTETGGLVEFGRGFPRDEQRAARAVGYALTLAKRTPRVARVYLYNWTGSKPGERFDAGLVGPGGMPRPAYGVLKAALKG